MLRARLRPTLPVVIICLSLRRVRTPSRRQVWASRLQRRMESLSSPDRTCNSISCCARRASAEQTVVSDADAAAVDTTRTVVGDTITREESEALPVVTRAPFDLVFTLPGVTEEPLSVRDLAEDRNTSARSTPE